MTAKTKNTERLGLWVFLGVLGVVAIWISTIWIVPQLFTWLTGKPGGSLPDEYGPLGDMFGAVNSLFSGLALGAIALTLWFEARSRRDARKPLVVGSIPSKDVTICRPVISNGKTVVQIRVPVSFSNQSADAALNVSSEIRTITDRKSCWQVGLDGPLVKDEKQEEEFLVEMSEEQWGPLLGSLTAQCPVEIELRTEYRSLEGVNWTTEVIYEFSVKTSDQYYGLLDTIRNGTWKEAGVWASEALVPLTARIKRGSWDHRKSSNNAS